MSNKVIVANMDDVNELESRLSESIVEISNDVNNIAITGKNLLNPSKLVVHKQIDSHGNIIESSTNSAVSERIALPSNVTHLISVYRYSDGNEMITERSAIFYNFYNDNGFISKDEGGGAVTIPNGATYAIIQTASSYFSRKEFLLVAFGDVQIPYESYSRHINPELVETLQDGIDNANEKADSIIEDVSNLKNDVIGTFVIRKNKLNPNTFTEYRVINNVGAVVVSATAHGVSDKIDIGAIKHVILSYLGSNMTSHNVISGDVNSKIAFYKSDDTFLSFASSNDVDIPNDADYIRVQISRTYMTALIRCMVEFSDTMTSYEPYTEGYNGGLNTRVAALEKKHFKGFLDGIFDGSYSKIKIIGDSITQGVGSSDYNPLNSSSSTYATDVAAEKANGTWSWDRETVNTYYGDGKVVLVNGNNYFRENSGVKCYANKLKKYLEQKYGVVVNNWGTRGLSAHHFFSVNGVCKDGVTRNMAQQLIEEDDDSVICMFGTNDRADSFDKLKGEIQQIVDYVVREKGKKLVLMASIPARKEAETNTLKMEDIASIVCSVARENNIEFISLNKSMTEYLRNTGKLLSDVTSDTLHPNDLGHDLMYRFVLEGLGFGSPIPDATWI